jgi:hypothetical protein
MAFTRPGAVNAVSLAVCSSSGEAELVASEPTMDAEVVVVLGVGGVRRGLEGIAGDCSVEGGCEWDVGRGVFVPCGGPPWSSVESFTSCCSVGDEACMQAWPEGVECLGVGVATGICRDSSGEEGR